MGQVSQRARIVVERVARAGAQRVLRRPRRSIVLAVLLVAVIGGYQGARYWIIATKLDEVIGTVWRGAFRYESVDVGIVHGFTVRGLSLYDGEEAVGEPAATVGEFHVALWGWPPSWPPDALVLRDVALSLRQREDGALAPLDRLDLSFLESDERRQLRRGAGPSFDVQVENVRVTIDAPDFLRSDAARDEQLPEVLLEQLAIREDGANIRSIEGRCRLNLTGLQTWWTLEGLVREGLVDQWWTLTVTNPHLALDRSLTDRLRGPAREIWERFQGHAQVAVQSRMTFSRFAGFSHRTEVTFQSGRGRFEMVDLFGRIEPGSRLVFEDQRIEVEQLRARVYLDEHSPPIGLCVVDGWSEVFSPAPHTDLEYHEWSIQVQQAMIAEPIIRALKFPNVADTILRFGPSHGQADVSVTIVRTEEIPDERISLDVTVRDATLQYERFRYPVPHCEVRIQGRIPGALEVTGGTALDSDGVRVAIEHLLIETHLDREPDIALRLRVDGLDLGAVEAALSSELAEQVAPFHLAGTAHDVLVRFHTRPDPLVSAIGVAPQPSSAPLVAESALFVQGRIDQGRALPERFPVAITDMSGMVALRVTDRFSLTLHALNGRIGPGTASLDAQIAVAANPAPGAQTSSPPVALSLALEGRDLVVDDALSAALRAVAPSLADEIDAVALAGRFDVQGEVFQAPNTDHPQLTFLVRPRQMRLRDAKRFDYAVEDLQGEIRVRDQQVWIDRLRARTPGGDVRRVWGTLDAKRARLNAHVVETLGPALAGAHPWTAQAIDRLELAGPVELLAAADFARDDAGWGEGRVTGQILMAGQTNLTAGVAFTEACGVLAFETDLPRQGPVTAQGRIALAHAAWKDYTLVGLQGRFHYDPRTGFALPDADFRLAGGFGRLSAHLRPPPPEAAVIEQPRYRVRLAARQLRLERLAPGEDPRVKRQGPAQVDLEMWNLPTHTDDEGLPQSVPPRWRALFVDSADLEAGGIHSPPPLRGGWVYAVAGSEEEPALLAEIPFFRVLLAPFNSDAAVFKRAALHLRLRPQYLSVQEASFHSDALQVDFADGGRIAYDDSLTITKDLRVLLNFAPNTRFLPPLSWVAESILRQLYSMNVTGTLTDPQVAFNPANLRGFLAWLGELLFGYSPDAPKAADESAASPEPPPSDAKARKARLDELPRHRCQTPPREP